MTKMRCAREDVLIPTLKTINGERTVWGVDLERAITAGGVQPGDDLALVYRGKKRVPFSLTSATRQEK